MLKRILLTISLLLVAYDAFPFGNEVADEFLYGYLEGTYILIGKAPDSDVTYYGTVELINEGMKLRVSRMIDGKIVVGDGEIEVATADSIKVLRVRFGEGQKVYEATYVIGSDLDNYGRLTGYLYLKDGKTQEPGFESLFYDNENSHQTDERSRE